MSSPAMASILPSPRPSSSSLATQRNIAQRSLAPSSSSSTNVKATSTKIQSSRLAPAPSSILAPAPTPSTILSPPKTKPAPLASSISVGPPAPSSSSDASLNKKDPCAGPLVQPSKEWVLPPRAKPGRKPSETEPLTKRKAQNRASQRAFRERKQSYLADLEAKVAAYEAAEIDRSVEIQKVAQKLRAENEALRKEVGVWKDKYAQIDKFLIQVRANGGRLPGVIPSAKSGPGCKAPAHERVVTTPKRSVLVAPGAKFTKDKERSAGGVRFADAVPAKTEMDAESPNEQHQAAASVPLRRRPSISSAASPPSASISSVDVASPAGPVKTNATTSQTEPQLAPTVGPRKGSKPPLWSFELPKPPSPTAPSTSLTSSAGLYKSISLLSPSLLPHGGHLSVEGGCGFCTEASPCVCADDFLDLSAQSQPSHIAVPSDVPSALPLPKRATPSSASETSGRMSIGSLTHAKDVALDHRRRNTTKLWYTVTQPDSPSPPLPTTASANTSVPLYLKTSAKGKAGKKLWAVTEAPAEPVCTGDPSTCGACSTDPGLAAFCEAVTAATASPSSSLTPAASTLSPVRPGVLRSATNGELPSSPYSICGETIPSAWRQIRSHPRFSQWQGGLDLLAEVVSKRSGNSPLLPHAVSAKRRRKASVEIETPRSTTTTSLTTSNDRTTSKPDLLHTASDTTVHSTVRVKTEDLDEYRDDARGQKRRRIVIDREAVQEALALLDAGTAAQPRRSAGFKISGAASTKEEVPCPCPWRPGERRSS